MINRTSGKLLAYSIVMVCMVPGWTAGSDRMPARVSSSDWDSIRREYERNRYAATPSESGYQARNFGQRWTTSFDGRGFTITPDGGRWTWGLALQAYGYSGDQRKVRGTARLVADKERVSYDWDDTVSEWFVNAGGGLEHGFTVRRRPPGQGERLELRMMVRGGLRPRVHLDGRSVQFVDHGGNTVVNYGGLKVWDAAGRNLQARLQAEIDGLRLSVEDAQARYPITIDPIAQSAFLKASNVNEYDGFGFSVAISGDTVVVGAPGEAGNGSSPSDNSAGGSGAAYVFRRSGASWSQEAYLKASNIGGGDQFGYSVSISGGTIVVGAPYEDSNAVTINGDGSNDNASNSGAAYVFRRFGSTWMPEAYLKASNAQSTTGVGFPGDFLADQFGWSVSVDGDTIVVGSPGEDSNAMNVGGDQTSNSSPNSGAAYVFARSGAIWSQQAYLKASNTVQCAGFCFGSGDRFGFSVAVSGDTAVVGAPDQPFSRGMAYVFTRTAGVWSPQQDLPNPNPTERFKFGYSVGVSTGVTVDTIIVGAPSTDGNNPPPLGTAYVFTRGGSVWSQQAILTGGNTEGHDNFGFSVAVSGDTAVVGAPLEDSSATGIDGDGTSNGSEDSGAAYVFTRTGGVWGPPTYVKPSNTTSREQFGYAVAVSSGTLVAGANQEFSIAHASGAVYIFDPTNTAPTITALPVTLQQGNMVTAPIAIVNDAQTPAGSLGVSVVGSNPSNGVTIGTIANSNGTVTAVVTASAGATSTSFTLRVTDGVATTDGTLAVTVTPGNSAPAVSVSSPSVSVAEGGTAQMSGIYSDANAGDNVTITASIGVVNKSGTSTGGFTWSFLTSDGPAQSQIVTITAKDGQGGVSSTQFSLTVSNVAPTALLTNSGPIGEGGSAMVGLTGGTDASTTDAGSLRYFFSMNQAARNAATYAGSSTTPSVSLAFPDNGSYPVYARILDKDGGYTDYATNVIVGNAAPVVTMSAPASGAVYPVGTPVTFSGSFTDAGILDTHTAQWAFDAITQAGSVTESNGSGSVSGSYTFPVAGVYSVKLTVTDKDGGAGTATTVNELTAMVVIYDPSGAFVTGGGWINSPAGAYAAQPALTGKANFGFVSKYLPGANKPSGQTEFQFKAASLNFHSSSYEWLVVAGARAQFKGTGTINDTGAYSFLLTAIDGQQNGGGGTDRFRIKIWDSLSGVIVYDNQMGKDDSGSDATELGGGSIVIHKP